MRILRSIRKFNLIDWIETMFILFFMVVISWVGSKVFEDKPPEKVDV